MPHSPLTGRVTAEIAPGSAEGIVAAGRFTQLATAVLHYISAGFRGERGRGNWGKPREPRLAAYRSARLRSSNAARLARGRVACAFSR